MPRECAAGFRHLHQTEHAFVHARAAGSRNDNDRGAFLRSKLNRARDSFADDGTHGGREKSEIHYGDRNFIAVDHSMAANYGVDQSGALLIIFEAILIARHSLKA